MAGSAYCENLPNAEDSFQSQPPESADITPPQTLQNHSQNAIVSRFKAKTTISPNNSTYGARGST